jgi:hypothetical protein
MVETSNDGSTVCSYKSLQDFDWSMRLALASDNLSGVQRPLLQLQLDVLSSNGKLAKSLIELDRDELSSLLNSLKRAQMAIKKD